MPAKIEELVERIHAMNPTYDDAKAYATAWSIYCKFIEPGSGHCRRRPSQYLTGSRKAPKKRARSR